jgi:sec-independent protein translocase protein TatA
MIGPMAIHILGVVGHAETIQANILSPTDMLIVGIVAVMLFGNRLPSVARSLGRSLTEFKKGMQELEDEVKTSVYSEPPNRVTLQDLGQLATAHSEPPQLDPDAAVTGRDLQSLNANRASLFPLTTQIRTEEQAALHS